MVPTIDSKSVALEFNERINKQDLKGLASLMLLGMYLKARISCLKAGRSSLNTTLTTGTYSPPLITRDDIVIMVGHSECSEKMLDGPTLWTAKIRGDLVAEWRVYEDTTANCELLGID